MNEIKAMEINPSKLYSKIDLLNRLQLILVLPDSNSFADSCWNNKSTNCYKKVCVPLN